MEDKQRLTLYLESDLVQAIKIRALEDHTTVSALGKRLFIEELAKAGKQDNGKL